MGKFTSISSVKCWYLNDNLVLRLSSWRQCTKEESSWEQISGKYLKKRHRQTRLKRCQNEWNADTRSGMIMFQILLWIFPRISGYIKESDQILQRYQNTWTNDGLLLVQNRFRLDELTNSIYNINFLSNNFRNSLDIITPIIRKPRPW